MADIELHCANCGQPVDHTDKFCRECGLPTLRRAEAQAQVPTFAPNPNELPRTLDPDPEPQPFLREAAEPDEASVVDVPLHTSDVVRATNPTFAANLASSTALMVGLIVVFAIIGIALILLALRS